MLPAIQSGRLVVAIRSKPVLDDVVVVSVDGRDVIKRISQLAHGRVYLLGDNASASTDSRTYGFITAKAVRGVVIWPRTSKINSQA